MSTTGKVLVVLILLTSFGFFYLAAAVLQTDRNWSAALANKEAEVVAAEQEVINYREGTDLGKETFEAKIADLQDKLNTFNSEESQTALHNAVDQLKRVTSQGNVEQSEWTDAYQSYVSAKDQLDRSKDVLDQNLESFLQEVRVLSNGRGEAEQRELIGLSHIKRTINMVQQITVAQRTLANIERSDMDRTITVLSDRAASAENAVARQRAASEEAERQAQFRQTEVNEMQQKVQVAQNELDAVNVELEAVTTAIAALEARKQTATDDNLRLVAQLKEAEIRRDRQRGVADAILTDTGKAPRGTVQNVNGTNIVFDAGRRQGISPGNELYVYRYEPTPKFLGKLRVESSDSDQATGQMLPAYSQLVIKAGDIVSTEISPDTN